jgi:moderate conductance mechanosensitive channel
LKDFLQALVINYPKKYINCNVDIILPSNTELIKDAKEKIGELVKIVPKKYPRILISNKPIIKSLSLNTVNETIRLVFHIWPGRGSPIENTFKYELIRMLKTIESNYEDWMVSVHYEVEDNVIRVKKGNKS